MHFGALHELFYVTTWIITKRRALLLVFQIRLCFVRCEFTAYLTRYHIFFILLCFETRVIDLGNWTTRSTQLSMFELAYHFRQPRLIYQLLQSHQTVPCCVSLRCDPH